MKAASGQKRSLFQGTQTGFAMWHGRRHWGCPAQRSRAQGKMGRYVCTRGQALSAGKHPCALLGGFSCAAAASASPFTTWHAQVFAWSERVGSSGWDRRLVHDFKASEMARFSAGNLTQSRLTALLLPGAGVASELEHDRCHPCSLGCKRSSNHLEGECGWGLAAGATLRSVP